MYGVFKKLTANDVKITSFEAHKEYTATGSDWASSGVSTSSLYWSPNNKSTFSSESIKYFQLDKLYYRDNVYNRANLLEISDIPYKKQEKRLYETASVISIPQYTFGNEIQANTITIVTNEKTLKDDGLGNLYDTAVGKSGFPDEDNRVLYLAPVKAFKHVDLTIDYETGKEVVNVPEFFSGRYYDDSYFPNIVEYTDILFGTGGFDLPNTNPDNIQIDTPSILVSSTASKIEIEDRNYLNFNNDGFAISFWMYQSGSLIDFKNSANIGDKLYILTKEGAINAPTNVVDTDIKSNNENTIIPGTEKYPYKIWLEKTSLGCEFFFERIDGDTISTMDSNGDVVLAAFEGEFVHYTFQKSGSLLEFFTNGVKIAQATDNVSNYCSNKSNLVLFAKRNNDGSYDYGSSGDYLQATPIQQLMIWDKTLSTTEISKIYNSVTGTYPVGNVFYDNGFCVITHPSYNTGSIINPIQTITYRNTYPITEYEYQCSVGEQEYNYTNNLSVRVNPTPESENFKSFVSSSDFRPYVTTIGLYDDSNNLLAVGKLGQPIKMSEETDTTFVIRFDR